ncbi:MAG: biosynthetic-type acetolactate synthase large subunit [Candidatus Lokiarchaeota archaeon]|nr:biosynthetic-type acetolactate synthase large subunit [Candidatus Lokiarchaeota archaeon]
MIIGTDIIVKLLKDTKNTTLFGYPGGAIMPFYDRIYGDADIRLILVRHEQSAGHAADGFARASGRLGVCVTTSGPGATNLVTALANAYYDSSPVLAFSGQVSTRLIGNDAFQEADVVGCTMAVTKQNYQVKDVNNLGRVFKEAIYIATTGRPGPVFIDLPRDVQGAECTIPDPIPEKVELASYNPRVFSKGAALQIKRALDILFKAQYPVIIAGGGVALANASKELEEVVNLLRIPVVYTLMGKGVISDDHPYVLGMIGMHGRKRSNFAVSEADAILALGTRFSDRITGDLSQFPGQPSAKVIHVDIDTAEIGKNVPVDVPIVADLKLALQEFLEQVKRRLADAKNGVLSSWWYKYIKELKESSGIPDASRPGKTGRIIPEKIMFELNKILQTDDIVVTEVGQAQMYSAHYLNIRKPRTWISSGGLGTMGFGFPAGIGAKVAKPDSQVWVVAGDGSFQMNLHELATVKQHDIKINIIVVNNQYLGMVRQWQELLHEKRYSYTCLGCKDGRYFPDFVKLADAYGLEGVRVDKPEQVAGALAQASRSDGTFVVEIMVEPESNILPMLQPGGSLNTFYSRRREQKSIYDWYCRLPRTEAEQRGYKVERIKKEEDDVAVFFEDES